jgi:hypothetical protein
MASIGDDDIDNQQFTSPTVVQSNIFSNLPIFGLIKIDVLLNRHLSHRIKKHMPRGVRFHTRKINSYTFIFQASAPRLSSTCFGKAEPLRRY